MATVKTPTLDAGGRVREKHLPTNLGAAALDTTYAGNVNSIHSMTAANFTKWRAALAKVRTGQGSAKVLCLGDSTTMGVGVVSNSHAGAYPTQLRALLNSYHVPAVDGLGIPQQGQHNDGRFAATGAWAFGAYTGFGWGQKAQYKFPSGGAAGTLTYTPGAGAGPVDSFDVYYLAAFGSGLGATTLQIDGGATVPVDTGAAQGIVKTTITGASASNHVLTIGSPTGGDVWILGVEPYLSTARNVRVGNAGVGGSTSADWAGGDSTFGPIPTIKAYAPDMTILMLGINDAVSGMTPAAWKANVQTIINACKVSGDVLVASVVPSDQPGIALREQEYAAQAKTLTGVGFIDLNARQGNYSTNAANGWMWDGLHPNELGYSDVAGAMFQAVRTI